MLAKTLREPSQINELEIRPSGEQLETYGRTPEYELEYERSSLVWTAADWSVFGSSAGPLHHSGHNT